MIEFLLNIFHKQRINVDINDEIFPCSRPCPAWSMCMAMCVPMCEYPISKYKLKKIPKNNSYTWNTSGIPDGKYYIYAIIDDGLNKPVKSYSKGIVTIKNILVKPIYESIDFGGPPLNFW